MRIRMQLIRRAACLLLCLLLTKLYVTAQRYPGNSMDFVVPFPATDFYNNMLVHISAADRPADIVVTVRANQNKTVTTYHIAANTTLTLPQFDWRGLMMPGFPPDRRDTVYSRSVSIHSSAPVEAYVAYPLSQASGATRLLPVRQWGYEYTYLEGAYGKSNNYLCVTAAYDETKIAITPMLPTADGHPAGLPYEITLNKGQVYQLKVYILTGAYTNLTGTIVRAVPNSFGVTYPVGIYGGYTAMGLGASLNFTGSGDFEAEQLLPDCNWGKLFITAPFSTAKDSSVPDYTMYRVLKKEASTEVRRNGVTVPAASFANGYYEFVSDKAEWIEADNPITVAQIMFSADEITYPRQGGRDGEIIYLSPLDKALTRTTLYLRRTEGQEYNYVTLCVPTSALPTLLINGSNSLLYSYTHPARADYTVVVKKWNAPAGHVNIECSQPFSGIAYSLPQSNSIAESIGYDITPLFRPEGDAAITGKYDKGVMRSAICAGDTFRLQLKTEYLPQTLEWKLKGHPGLMPATDDKVFTNPVPDSTVVKEGHTYHYFNLPNEFYFNRHGDYAIPVVVTNAAIDNCNHQQVFMVDVTSKRLPVADFSITHNACAPFNTSFKAGAAGDTSTLTTWLWKLDNSTQSTDASPLHTYADEVTQDIYLKVTAANGCMADTVKGIALKNAEKPKVAFTMPAKVCLPGLPASFTNGTTYTGTASPLGFAWSMGDGGKSTTRSPEYFYQAPGKYTVKLVATAADGCVDSAQQVLSSFAQRPQAMISTLSDTVCAGSKVLLQDASVLPSGVGISTYGWLSTEGASAAATLEKQYHTPGEYQVQHFVTSTEGCISDTAQKNIVVYGVPVAEAGTDKTILEGAVVQLQGSVRATGQYTYAWTPAAAIVSDAASLLPVVAPHETTLFYLTAATWTGCTAYDSVWVYVLPTLVVPNAFSPNGDGNNDRWEIPGMNSYPGSLVQVFNRYGQKVFESRGYAQAWDGRMQGSPLPAGTYYYVINPGSGKPRQSGSLTIIR